MYEMKNRVAKPRWGVLYTLATLPVGFVGLIEIAIPAGAARQVLEVVVTLACCAAMAIWVRLNRVALYLAGAVTGSPYRIPQTTVPGAMREAQSPHGEVEGGAPLPHGGAWRDGKVREALEESHLAFGMRGEPLRVRHAAPVGEVSDERRDLPRTRARLLRSVLGVREAL
jgi:hypothetical protein